MGKRKKYSAEQKAIILREHLENNVSVSQLSEKYEVNPKDIYVWKKKRERIYSANKMSSTLAYLSAFGGQILSM